MYTKYTGMKTMMLLVTMFILLYFTKIYSNEIAQREQELTDVQSQIELQRQRAEHAEQMRISAEQSRQESQTNLTSAQRRIQELNAAEQSLRRSLTTSRNNLNRADSRLSEVQNSINELMILLMLVDQAEKKLRDNQNDAHNISILIKRLIFENRRVGIERLRLLGETTIREREVNTTTTNRRSEQTRANNLTTNIRQLESDIITFEQQQREYQARANELERIALALQDLINSFENGTPVAQLSFHFPSGFEAPVFGKILTGFGPKRHERYDISTNSNGIHVAVPLNTSIRAFADGEVVFADWFAGTGRMIIIDHKNGYHTVYSYNNSLLVRRGDMVTRGQIIAESGQTGAASEPSLHFEIRRNGIAVNPMDFISM